MNENKSGEEGRCGNDGTRFLIKDSVLFFKYMFSGIKKQLTEYLTFSFFVFFSENLRFNH